jgi:hypothetical protein
LEYEREAAERAVRAAAGVRVITDLIRLRPALPIALLPPHHRLCTREDGWVPGRDRSSSA